MLVVNYPHGLGRVEVDYVGAALTESFPSPPGCELVLSGRRTSIMPAYQPANLARDPIGSREGRRKFDEQREKESGARTGRTRSRWAKLCSGGTRPQVASKEKRRPTHTARSTSEYAAHQPSARRAAESRARTRGCGPCCTAPRRGQAGGGDRQEEVAAAAGHGSNPRPGDDFSISSSRRSLP
jgi:hypothetical protein